MTPREPTGTESRINSHIDTDERPTMPLGQVSKASGEILERGGRRQFEGECAGFEHGHNLIVRRAIGTKALHGISLCGSSRDPGTFWHDCTCSRSKGYTLFNIAHRTSEAHGRDDRGQGRRTTTCSRLDARPELIVDDHVQERRLHLRGAVVLDEAELAELNS